MKREDVIIRLGRTEDADVLAQVVSMGIGCDKTLKGKPDSSSLPLSAPTTLENEVKDSEALEGVC